MTDFTMKKDADGVAIITWDVPGKSMNVLSLDGAATLNTLIDDALADGAVLVEWPEKAASYMPRSALAVRLTLTPDGLRQAQLTGSPNWTQRIKEIIDAAT